ncbi:Extracellular metalloprotease [Seminavis robusta]|uniref:Extracellular metalloprotease n=1 Tax=Seminavis robusta TaxID=568900 RepID=A0A9N8H3K1_9STRA|nr:Extracellular metalloprotease [Seminavis robusta]|eukprot:Sro89_g046980.1 Extracellular metalloprotease (364) ;mRNA; f:70232-71837
MNLSLLLLMLLLLLLCVLPGSSGHNHHHHHDDHHHNHDHALEDEEAVAEKDDRRLDKMTKQQAQQQEQHYGSQGQYKSFRQWTQSSDFKTTGARCGSHASVDGTAKAKQTYAKWMKQHDCDDETGNCPYMQHLRMGHSFRTIQVYWHSIQKTQGTEGASETVIWDAMDVLNSAFVGTGFQFDLMDITVTNYTPYWEASRQSQDEFDMKAELHRGSCEHLNIYSTGADGLLGWAWFPWDCESSDWYDGVVLNYNTLPGGSAFPYNLGDTLTHEVGHWLGLFHTFEGGCSANGDFISDTPAEAFPDYDCEQNRDSCGDGGRADDVTNFMNYGPDSCMDHFTIGQVGRMHAAVSAYRPKPPRPWPY